MEPIKKLDALMAIQFPEQEYLIDRLIPESSITILSGTSGSYKTYTLLQMAISVASNTQLFEQFNTRQTGVLIVDEENGERLMQKRLLQLNADSDLPIYFTPKTGFKLEEEMINSLISQCKSHNIGLVIIDSLVRVHNADENSSREMAKVYEKVRRFTQEGIAVLITHHNRKQGAFSGNAGAEMRGTSENLAAVDCHIGVVARKETYLRFEQTKQRYAKNLGKFEVKIISNDNDFKFEYLGGIENTPDKSDLLLTSTISLLKVNEELSQKDILAKLEEAGVKTNEHTLRNLLALWIKEGVLLPPSAGLGKTKIYRLAGEVSDE